MDKISRYRQAWSKFHQKISGIKSRRLSILKKVTKQFDQERLDALRKEINKHE